MKCKDVEGLLSLYHDGELKQDKREAFERHLARCPKCQAKLRELVALDELVRDGEAERVPDPGHHYWQSFSLRVTHRLAEPRTLLIRRPARRKLFGWQLLPYLSAGVAVVLAVAIAIPLLKQQPTQIPEKEAIEVKESPITLEAPKGRAKTGAAGQGYAGAKPSILPEGEAAKLEKEGSQVSAPGLEELEKQVPAVPAEPSLARTRDEEERKGAAVSSYEEAIKLAPAEEPGTSAGLHAQGGRSGEVVYVVDAINANDVAASLPPPSGVLKVTIDSGGHLGELAIYKTSGDTRLDSLALSKYNEDNKDKVFRQRKATLYVPFYRKAEN